MAACQTVTSWMTEKVVVPVMETVQASATKCQEIKTAIEESWQEPVEKQISQLQEQCNDWPWPLSWACDLVSVIVTVIAWVVVTVVKWVVTVACQTITKFIEVVVGFVLKIVAWAVSFVVCILTDPLAALASLWDVWLIWVDAFGGVLDHADTLLADVVDILSAVEDLLGSIASILGRLGVVLGVFKALVHWVREFVSAVRDVVAAAGDVVLGVLGANPCRAARGATDLLVAAARVGVATGFGLAPWAVARGVGAVVGGVRDAIDQYRLEIIIREALAKAFGEHSERTERSLKRIAINIRPMGLPFEVDARRMFLSSENLDFNPRALHDAGVIDLYRLAGYTSGCGKVLNEPDAEVVYAGTDVRVTLSDIRRYLRDGPDAVPEFRVYAISLAKFTTHLEMARRKLQSLGVRISWEIDEIEAFAPDHLPLNVHDADGKIKREDKVQQALFATMDGRDNSGAKLNVIPVISHFHYIRWPAPDSSELFGLTSTFRPASNDRPISGVTFRNLTPDWGLRFVLSHEIGHYLGLDHPDRGKNDRPVDEIMFSPKEGGVKIAWTTPFQFLLLDGEPRFTHDDARTVWEWITSDPMRDVLLP